MKVWFQNRRTKFKRVKSEEDGDEGEGTSSHHHGDYSIQHHDSSDSDSECDVQTVWCHSKSILVLYNWCSLP